MIIKNWLRGSKDLGGGRKIRYYKLLHEKGNTEPPLPQLDMSGDLNDTVVYDNIDDDDDDDGTVARRNVSFRITATPLANSPILQQ